MFQHSALSSCVLTCALLRHGCGAHVQRQSRHDPPLKARWYIDPGKANPGFRYKGFERRATFWHAYHVLAAILVSSSSFEVTEDHSTLPKPGYANHHRASMRRLVGSVFVRFSRIPFGDHLSNLERHRED